MKTLVTFFFFFLISFAAQAQNNTAEVKVETAKKEVVVPAAEKESVARLYRFKNSRIKKELSFKTSKSTSKLA
ncbi:hypothetical protein [Muriicola marianensis]|uniref:Uncharacterized protein n=1 Tax=Muriicola marianensis TaxID=1324801 RepID=A0ABQ1R659_9FLAO|nr:hypothetical protein [Muriicola marianensis]GGD57402.1 hypothetical protein GCM10011361_24910 [Muriicola marianensis]